MSNQTEAHLSAARRLLEQECALSGEDEWAVAAGRVYQLIFRQLSPVIGNLGVRALLARCLKLKRAEFPCLAEVRLPPEFGEDDELGAHAVATALTKVERVVGLKAASALYATFFALLSTFIGERLTWQIVQRTFAEVDGTASKETE